MIALCVDDEVLLLESLKKAVEESPDITAVAAFDDEYDALDWAGSHSYDVAFLDIRLHDLAGIGLAELLRKKNPNLPVIFCTGHREYALDAIQHHATGYLMKPIRADAVQKELDHIKKMSSSRTLLRAHCFGTFEVYADEVPLHFKRAKTKELLAYLIDRRGAAVSSRELCAQLWENNTGEQYGINYLHQLASDLRRTLREVGAEEVFVTNTQGYAVDPSLIDCDYYRFLNGDQRAVHKFIGEYMSNYSWSEFTCAYLLSKIDYFS